MAAPTPWDEGPAPYNEAVCWCLVSSPSKNATPGADWQKTMKTAFGMDVRKTNDGHLFITQPGGSITFKKSVLKPLVKASICKDLGIKQGQCPIHSSSLKKTKTKAAPKSKPKSKSASKRKGKSKKPAKKSVKKTVKRR